ncbi:MAG: alkaline phosphatase D family protein [Opitutales bacterium]
MMLRLFISLAFMLAGVIAGLAQPVLDHIAFGSCARENRPQPIWDTLVAAEPDVWIWAGDNAYLDTEDPAVMRAKYARLAAKPGYQRLQATGIPILATWDDHDYGVNDGDAGYPMKATSQQIFLDFFGVAADSARREREGVYHAETFGPEGQRVQVILLDTRYHRSALTFLPGSEVAGSKLYQPNKDPGATVLGDDQWAWLEEQLSQPADLRLIVSSIQVIPVQHRFEKWANFPLERQRLFDLIRKTRAEGVLFLSGDRHHAELSRINLTGLYTLYDLTSSGLTESRPPIPGETVRYEENIFRVGSSNRLKLNHFGQVLVDWEQADPQIRLRIVGIDGQAYIDWRVRLSALQFPGG